MLGPVSTIRVKDLVHSQERRGVFNVLPVNFPVVCAAEVVLCPRSTNGWKLLVTVHVEFNFALTPPSVVLHVLGQVRVDVMPHSIDSIDNSVRLLVRKRIGATKLGMEVAQIIGNVTKSVVDLVIVIHGPMMAVL